MKMRRRRLRAHRLDGSIEMMERLLAGGKSVWRWVEAGSWDDGQKLYMCTLWRRK